MSVCVYVCVAVLTLQMHQSESTQRGNPDAKKGGLGTDPCGSPRPTCSARPQVRKLVLTSDGCRRGEDAGGGERSFITDQSNGSINFHDLFFHALPGPTAEKSKMSLIPPSA